MSDVMELLRRRIAFTKESANGERVRMRHEIARLRALIDGFEIGLASDVPLLDSARAVADAAARITSTAARFDAYQRVMKGA